MNTLLKKTDIVVSYKDNDGTEIKLHFCGGREPGDEVSPQQALLWALKEIYLLLGKEGFELEAMAQVLAARGIHEARLYGELWCAVNGLSAV